MQPNRGRRNGGGGRNPRRAKRRRPPLAILLSSLYCSPMNTPRKRSVVRRVVVPGLTLLASLAGCVERTLTIDSDPPGALVYLNDQEVGRTPLRREFAWYGWYDVAVRKEGYRTVKASSPVIAPPWMWVPLDLVMELLPFPVKDRHRLHYKLAQQTEEDVDPARIVRRG